VKAPRGRTAALILGSIAVVVINVALWMSRDWTYETWLIWKLQSSDIEKRRDAAEELARMRSVRAVPHLLEVIAEAEMPGIEKAISVDELRRLKLDNAEFAFSAIMTIGRKAWPAIVRGLHHRIVLARMYCAIILREMGPPPGSLPALSEAARDPAPLVRQRSIEALFRLGPAAWPVIAQVLDEDELLREFILTRVDADFLASPEAARVLEKLASEDPDMAAEVEKARSRAAERAERNQRR